MNENLVFFFYSSICNVLNNVCVGVQFSKSQYLMSIKTRNFIASNDTIVSGASAFCVVSFMYVCMKEVEAKNNWYGWIDDDDIVCMLEFCVTECNMIHSTYTQTPWVNIATIIANLIVTVCRFTNIRVSLLYYSVGRSCKSECAPLSISKTMYVYYMERKKKLPHTKCRKKRVWVCVIFLCSTKLMAYISFFYETFRKFLFFYPFFTTFLWLLSISENKKLSFSSALSLPPFFGNVIYLFIYYL